MAAGRWGQRETLRSASAAGARPGRGDAGRHPRRTARAAGEASPGQCQPQPPLAGAARAGAGANKKATRAAPADPHARAACPEQHQRLALADRIVLDECGIPLALTRPPARAPSGERAHGTAPFPHGRHLSVIRARGWHGVCAPLTLAGAVNSAGLARYGAPRLVPGLRPGTLVVLDHVTCPYAPRASELREAAGAGVVHIPAYSPALTPLEEGSAKRTETLRSFKARTKRKRSHALAQALALGTAGDIRGWCEHCGYVFSLK